MRTNLGPAQPAAKRYSRGVRERARREPREPRPAPPTPGEAREAPALLLADGPPGRRSRRGRGAEPLRASPRPARHAIRYDTTTEESAEGRPGTKLEAARSGGVTHLGETARRCAQRRVLLAATTAEEDERSGRRTGRRGAAGRSESEEERRPAAAAEAKGWRGATRGGAEAADAATGGKGAEAIAGGMALAAGGRGGG